MSGTTFDDPNREALGLDPIWTGAGDTPPGDDGDLPGAPGAFTVAAVQSWVDANPHAAADVLTHERAGKNRTTLVDWLEGFIESHDGVDG